MLDFFISFFWVSDTVGLFIAFISTLVFKSQYFDLKNRKSILIYFFTYFILTLYGNLYPLFYYWFPPLYPVDSNNWLYDNIPIILSTTLFPFFYVLVKSNIGKIISVLSFLIVFVFYLLTWRNSINKDQNLEYYLIYTIFIILNSLVYLIIQVNEIQTDSLFDKVEFWFITSIVFYSSSCSLFWVFSKDIYTKYPTVFNVDYLWFCHNTILLISCIIYSLAIYLKTPQSR